MSGITLTTPFSITGSITESDTQAACVSTDISWSTGVITSIFSLGTVIGNALAPGGISPTITFTVNMITGAWVTLSSNTTLFPNQSGTFSGAGFTSFQTTFINIRNSMESFAAGSFLPGTSVPWAQV
jgi:hypothetical protein